MMGVFQRGVFAVSRFCAHISAAVCVLMLSYILLEISLRTFFGKSTYVMEEFVGYGVGAMAFLAMGYCLEAGSLIRVNLLLDRSSRVVRRVVEVICCGLTLWAMMIAIWAFWTSAKRDYIRGYGSATLADVPLWIPESILLFGMVLFWVQLIAYMLRAITGAASPIPTSENTEAT